MNQIEQLMGLADHYAMSFGDNRNDAPNRQALRAAIEAALTPGEPYVWYDPQTGETWTPGDIADGGCVSELMPLYTAPQPQPKQEPVANAEYNRAIDHAIEQGIEAAAFLRCWSEGDWEGCREFGFEPGAALTHPAAPQPQREWVGLTNPERAKILAAIPAVPFEGDWHGDLIDAIETKLREKNGGGRDWSMLEATQDSLREHMAMIHRDTALLRQALEYLERSADHYPVGHALSRQAHKDTIAALRQRLENVK